MRLGNRMGKVRVWLALLGVDMRIWLSQGWDIVYIYMCSIDYDRTFIFSVIMTANLYGSDEYNTPNHVIVTVLCSFYTFTS